MTQQAQADTRTRLLAAAADLIAVAPGEDFSLRAVCDAAGVKMPTLYHFFGSKQGLLDAVVEHGFDMYLGEKGATESTGDPIRDIRLGWDAHVAFGLANPGFYTLMYGKVRPGIVPPSQERPSEMLLALTRRADEEGRLVVTPEQAAAHVLACNIGATLRQILLAEEDPALSAAVREGVIAAITGARAETTTVEGSVRTLTELAAANPDTLGEAETHLLTRWLRRLAEAAG